MEKLKLSFRSVPNQRGIENAEKKAKNLKNTIMASFQTKIVWKRPRKREKKIIVSLRSFLTRYRELQKIAKK